MLHTTARTPPPNIHTLTSPFTLTPWGYLSSCIYKLRDTHVFITDLTQQVAFAEVSKDRFTSHRVAALRG